MSGSVFELDDWVGVLGCFHKSLCNILLTRTRLREGSILGPWNSNESDRLGLCVVRWRILLRRSLSPGYPPIQIVLAFSISICIPSHRH